MSGPREPHAPSPPPGRGRSASKGSRVGGQPSRFDRPALIIFIFGLGLMPAIQAGSANSSQIADHSKSMLGNYECRDGSLSSVAPNVGAHNETYSASKPYIRITVASTAASASVEPQWWSEQEKAWKENREAQLRIMQVETDALFWTIRLEGSFPDWPSPSIVSGHLSLFSALYDKPVLVFAQHSAVFARAGAFVCDKI
jgi:hypothetical protein